MHLHNFRTGERLPHFLDIFIRAGLATGWQYGSFSIKQVVRKKPVASSPSAKPPIPANKSSVVSTESRQDTGVFVEHLLHPALGLPTGL